MDKLPVSLVVYIIVSLICLKVSVNGQSASAISCYSCTGIECSRSSLLNQQAKCSDPLDNCVTVFDGYRVVVRGCYWEVPDEYRKQCESGNSLQCHRCITNLCNNLARQDVNCLSCNSTQEPDCLQNPWNIERTRCPVSATENSFCFVRYDEKETIRGCATSLRDQISCYDDAACRLCSPDTNPTGCNSIEFPENRRKCLTCSAGNCSNATRTSVYCDRSNDQCVSYKMNGKVTRKCVSTLSQAENTFCTNNAKSCTKCSEDNCNLAFENSSSVARASFGLIIAFCLFMFAK